MSTTKSKRQPKSFFRYLLDEFILFRRDFYFETTASYESLINGLSHLHHVEQGFLFNRRIVPSAISSASPLRFELRSERLTKSGWLQSAKAEIFIYDDAGKIILNGSIVIGKKPFWVVTFFLYLVIVNFLLGVSETVRLIWPCIAAIVVFTTAFSWFGDYRDRNHLYKFIQSVVESPDEYPDKAKTS